MEQLLQLSEEPRYDNLETIFEVAEQTIGRVLDLEEKERIKHKIEQMNISHKYDYPEKFR